MNIINSIFLKYSRNLLKEIDRSRTNPMEYQMKWFRHLIGNGAESAFGKEHGFDSIKTIKDFQQRVPIRDYNATAPYINRLLQGEDYVLWNGKVRMFAKSSGTSSDKSKYIPVSRESLQVTHYGGFKRMLASYVNSNPNSRIFLGKALTLGGSVTPDKTGKIFSGDLSALLLRNSPAIVEVVRTPSRKTALIGNFEEKLAAICRESARENVTNFSGVPSWNLMLLNKILEYTGKSDILQVWPNMELFMHGGIGFEPYRPIFHKLIPTRQMHYLENYNASEGYFAFQDDELAEGMLLTVNNGIFYEFIPMNILDDVLDGKIKEIPTLAEVETGVNYAIVISTIGGLWRYLIGDCVRFTSTYPHRIVITGRTQLCINAFGEELMISNAEQALAKACKKCNCTVSDFTVAPVFMELGDNSQTSKGFHRWAIEFSEAPEDTALFTSTLDKCLTEVNSDYEAKRAGNATMKQLELSVLPQGTFLNWMRQRGKVGGQNKVPRLYKDDRYIKQLCQEEI